MSFSLLYYRFRHWLFKWNVDEEGDIVFSFASMIHFTKYKEHTLIKFAVRHDLKEAPKYMIQQDFIPEVYK